jgi:hypothetical protein
LWVTWGGDIVVAPLRAEMMVFRTGVPWMSKTKKKFLATLAACCAGTVLQTGFVP